MKRTRIVTVLTIASIVYAAAIAISAAAPAKPSAARAGAKPTAKGGSTARAKMIERGRMLAVVSGCNDCHTPGTLFGAPDFARQFGGSDLGWSGPWGTTYARNLTPDPETGLGYYKEHEIVAAIKSGHRLDGSPMLPPMPWQNMLAFDDADLAALAAFMLSLPPIQHAVPDRLPPGQQPTGSFLAFPAPSAWDAPRDSTSGKQ